jgi:hypothetical protein
MVLRKTFLVLIFSIIFTTGCSSGNETEKIKPVLHQETIGDLAYEIRLSKNRFGMNDEIVVYTKVTNRGKETLTYVSGSSSCPNHAIVNIINQESNTRLARKPYGPCTTDLGKSQLEPGQVIEDMSIFIAKYQSKSGLEPALPGTYDVQIALPPEDLRITEDYQSIPINPRPSTKTPIILSDNH